MIFHCIRLRLMWNKAIGVLNLRVFILWCVCRIGSSRQKQRLWTSCSIRWKLSRNRKRKTLWKTKWVNTDNENRWLWHVLLMKWRKMNYVFKCTSTKIVWLTLRMLKKIGSFTCNETNITFTQQDLPSYSN